MKKDELFDFIHDFIYYGSDDPELEDQLVEVGIDTNKLWESVDWFLEKIAEKYGED